MFLTHNPFSLVLCDAPSTRGKFVYSHAFEGSAQFACIGTHTVAMRGLSFV